MNYLVLALKRSGHHVFTNWIAAHTKQEFYNNCCFGWKDKKLLTMIGHKEAVSGIANIEDFNPNYLDEYDFKSFPFMKNCIKILFIRSLNNWLASSFARKFQIRADRKDVYKYLLQPYINDSKLESPSRIDLYCKHLRLAHEWEKKKGCVVATFDDFIKSEDYRKAIAGKLDIKWNCKADKSILIPTKYGGGSSFYNTKNNIFNRDKSFENSTEFQELSSYAAKKAMDTMYEIGAV